MDIRPVTAQWLIESAGPLLAAHYDEIARNKRVMVLEPDEPMYRALDRAGALIALGAFVGDDLVGYAVTILNQKHLHYAGLCYAQNDVLFVSRHARASRAGLALIRETELAAAQRGARMALWHAKQDTPLAALLTAKGYAVQDIVYSRELVPQAGKPLRNMVRLAENIDPALVLSAIRPEMWDQITARQGFDGSAHGDTRTIFLRGPADPADAWECMDSVMYPLGEDDDLRAAVEDVIAAVPLDLAEMGRVMLVSLKSGGRITPHADEGRYAAHFSRFHVALQSDAGNTFRVCDESIHMQPGEAWWFEHRSTHEVRNDSATERIHLIFDARVSGLWRP